MKKVVKNNISEQPVEFITRFTPPPTSFEPHSGPTEVLRKKVGDIKSDYQVLLNQLTFIIGDTDAKVKETGFTLDEIKISLGFNAKGRLAFIAEAGVEASIEVAFKRK
jgi:hypothetical protein